MESRLLGDTAFAEEFDILVDEITFQYVANELDADEREQAERYFFQSDDRRNKLRFALVLKDRAATEAPRINRTKRPSRSHWAIAAAVLIVAGLSFGTWRAFLRQSEVDKGLLALNEAYRQQRPLESRIGGLNYAPYSSSRGAEVRVDGVSLKRATVILLDEVSERPTAASHHALGQLFLAEKKFDEAIAQLVEAIKTDPNNPRLHSDLGVALLERAKADRTSDPGKTVEEFAKSLAQLNKAIELDDSLLEALFNRALVHQEMMLPQQAREDWLKYLEKDPTSQWAAEARQNLKLIESQKNTTSQNKDQVSRSFIDAYRAGDDEAAWQLISANRDVTGSFIENGLIDKYLDMQAKGHDDAARESLKALSYAGELESIKANDRFISDLVRFYQSTTPAQRVLLAQARNLMSQGHKSLKAFKPEQAVESYGKAKSIFDRSGNTGESLYVRYPTGHAYLLMHKSELSLSIFQSIASDSDTYQYRWLLAQALNGLGNVQTGFNDYSTALDHTNRSWEISEQTGDVKSLMKTADQLSNIYTRLGNYRKAIEYQQRGLALFGKGYVEPLQAWRSHFLMATPLHLLGLNAAAADFQKEALRVAQEAGLPYYICRSHIVLGLIYGSQRNFEEATRNVLLAFDLAKNISSDAIRADTIAYSSLQLGHLYRQAGDFTKATASYDQVLKTYDGTDYKAFLYAAHKGKLLSCLAQGGCQTADQEIETTLSLFENHRPKILEEENKFIFFDAEQSVYDVVIDYEYSVKRNSQTAFELSERSRARSLLGITSTETLSPETHSHHTKGSTPVFSGPMGIEEIRRRMPDETQILQYSVLQDKILIWLISKSSAQAFEKRIDASHLREKVSNYLRLVSSPQINNEGDFARASADFYDLLIRPAEAALDRNKPLCIVPDKVLNYLPYGAFISGSSGKYLTQEYVLTRAPSSTIFIISSENALDRINATPEKLLSVGNPSFDRSAFPTLDDLPSAAREAGEVAAYYNSAFAITGNNALKKRIVREMERANVIHMALHAIVNEQAPLRSKLLFARDTSFENGSIDDDVLQTHEISKIRLGQTRLVVLSACQTGTGRFYNGEGVISVSRHFIAKGVPLVVASLWPVDSEATAELMISFHKNRRKNGFSTAEALCLAQREMLNNPESRYRQPYYWASFVIIGGYAEF